MSPLRVGWIVAFTLLAGVRLWNGLTGPLLRGYDDHGHVGYVLFLDLYHAVPWADQGWSYFHPPLHYLFGWVLAQPGSADVLLHGIALLNGVTSLAIAWMAAVVVRRVTPEREELALLAFLSVGLLPVYLYSATMAGNELTAAFFSTAALCVFVANECRGHPLLRVDAAVGVLLGLALLSKVSAVLVLGAVGLAMALRLVRAEALGVAFSRIVLRGVLVAGIAAIVASPYYARNVAEFGTPFKMSRDNPHVARLESLQPPGSRTWVDFVAFPPQLLLDPNPREEHLLHSVWGSAYAQTWADSRMSWDNLPAPAQPLIATTRAVMATLGLLPTALVVLGALLAFGDLGRRRRQDVYVPVFCIAAVSLASFVYFALAAPQYSALKASYLLGLTLPYAVFLARGLEAVGRFVVVGAFAVGVPAVAAAVVHADGVWLPRLGDHHAVASIDFYFGDVDEASEFYRAQRRAVLGQGATWNDELSAIALARGDPFEARSILETVLPKSGRDPFRWNALAVADALAGDTAQALALAELAVEAGAGEVGLVNRGVLHASLGNLAEAETDLREALELNDALAPAWHALSDLLERQGRTGAAVEARDHAARAAESAPRNHPYGIPDGLGQYPSVSLGLRFMLWPGEGGLALGRPPFRAADAVRTQPAEALFAARPHVVLIVVDTLRADHLGAYGYPRPTSPQIDRLAREGVRFANVSAPSSWTLPSVASIFTSQPPDMHKANSWGRPIPLARTTLVERLRSAGYATRGVSANFVHVTEKNHFDQGFEEWRTLSYELQDDGVEALLVQKGIRYREATADEVNEAVFEMLPPSQEHPLFLYVHYMEPHSAYAPPDVHRRAFARNPEDAEPVTSSDLAALVRGDTTATLPDRSRMIDLYDAEIAAVDAGIGALLDGLRDRGFGDKLVVAVAADHGEAFGEHDSWFHGLNLHREALSVPLVLWDSREPRDARVVDAPSDLLDVPTTLLVLAGVARMPGMFGRNLLSDGPRFERPLVASLGRDKLFEQALRPRSHRRAATYWPWKIIVDSRWRPSLYQLEDDPGELRPMTAEDPRVSPDLRKKAIALATPPMFAPKGGQKGAKKKKRKAPGPTKRELDQLRALGYAE